MWSPIDDSRFVAYNYKLKLAKATKTMADMADTIIGIDPTLKTTEVAEDDLQADRVDESAHVAVAADKVPAKV